MEVVRGRLEKWSEADWGKGERLVGEVARDVLEKETEAGWRKEPEAGWRSSQRWVGEEVRGMLGQKPEACRERSQMQEGWGRNMMRVGKGQEVC